MHLSNLQDIFDLIAVRTYQYRVTLVRLQRLMIGELHVDGASTHLWRIGRVVGDD